MSWDIKPKFAISFPSEIVSTETTHPGQTLLKLERVNFDEVINQTTQNSVSEAHIGLSTSLGDFSGSFVIYETSKSMALLDELIAKNLYFDIVVTGDDTGTADGVGSEWTVEQSNAIGCKISGRSRSYTYGTVPMRTYNFKYLKSRDSEKDENDDWWEIPFGNGIFNVSIEKGEELTQTDRDSIGLETLGDSGGT